VLLLVSLLLIVLLSIASVKLDKNISGFATYEDDSVNQTDENYTLNVGMLNENNNALSDDLQNVVLEDKNQSVLLGNETETGLNDGILDEEDDFENQTINESENDLGYDLVQDVNNITQNNITYDNISDVNITENLNENFTEIVFENETLEIVNESLDFNESNDSYILEQELKLKSDYGVELLNVENDSGKYGVKFNLLGFEKRFGTLSLPLNGYLQIDGVLNLSNINNIEFNPATETRFKTNIIAVNTLTISNATVILPKEGNVDAIYRCAYYNFEENVCDTEWTNAKINFEQNETYVWFTVYGFSAYVGVSLDSIEQSEITVSENSVDLRSIITLNCSGETLGTFSNVSLYGDFNGNFEHVQTKSASGSNHTTSFDINLSEYLGKYTIKDSTYNWNCLYCDTDSVCNWSYANGSFSGWDLGTYNKTRLFFNNISLSNNDSDKELPVNGGSNEFINMNGNIGYWKFNSNTLDSSGNNNHATVVSNVSFTDGLLNEGEHFDGASYLEINSTPISQTITVSAWVKTSSGGYVIGNDGSYMFRLGGSGQLIAYTKAGTSCGSPYTTTMLSNNNIALGEWQHIAWVRNSNGTQEFYINGVLDNRTTLSSSTIPTCTYGRNIGAYRYWNGVIGGYFSGDMDEVIIWNRVLTSDEIKSIYDLQSREYFESGYYESRVYDAGITANWNNLTWDVREYEGEVIDSGTINTSNIIGYWKLNSNALDSSDNGNDGTINGDTLSVTGKFNDAYYFDGASDYISITNDASLDTEDITISAWIKLNSYSGSWQDILSYGDEGHIFAVSDNNKILAGVQGSGPTCEFEGSDIILNEWYNVVMTRDASSNNITIYFNGQYDTSNICSVATPTLDEDIWIGGCNTYGEHFDGIIDEVVIFNRTLSFNEINDWYKQGVTRLNLSVKSCDDVNCSGDNYEFDCNDSNYCDISNLDSNRYMRYKVNFETNDTEYSPELLSNSVTISYELSGEAPNITTVYPNSTYGESYEDIEIIDVLINEPESRIFNITYTNESDVFIKWYVNNYEKISVQNQTYLEWVGNYTQEGEYLVLVNVSNDYGFSYQYWNLTVNNTVEPYCYASTVCASGYVPVMSLSDYSDAHGSVNITGTYAYDYLLCCNESEIKNESCDYIYGSEILRLSNYTNAHAEQSGLNNYAYPVCVSTENNYSCSYSSTCNENESCVVTISNVTNAHLADCSINPYATKVCCGFIANAVPYIISDIPNMTWPQDTVNDSLYLTNYFFDPEGDDLNYTYTSVQNITVEINNNTGQVTLTPQSGFSGERNVIFTAYDPYGGMVNSNVVLLNVTSVIISPVALLDIWEDSDTGTVYTNNNTNFYANYSNSNGEPINGTNVYCEIKFNTTGNYSDAINMTFNSVQMIYQYNTSFSINGTYYWNVLCEGSILGYAELNLTENFVITQYVPTEDGGGGDGGCTPSWSCGEWSPLECPISEIQTRTCIDTNDCGSSSGKPSEERSCVYVIPIVPEEPETETEKGGKYEESMYLANITQIEDIKPDVAWIKNIKINCEEVGEAIQEVLRIKEEPTNKSNFTNFDYLIGVDPNALLKCYIDIETDWLCIGEDYSIYKCKDWDFEKGICKNESSWVSIIDLKAGLQKVEIYLEPGDPGLGIGPSPITLKCGNGICENNEDCDNCVRDCGVCSKNEEPEGLFFRILNWFIGSESTTGLAVGECIERWECGEWSSYNEYGYRERNCSDARECGTTFNKPGDREFCKYIEFGCSNGVQDQNEEGVDCGGVCEPCVLIPAGILTLREIISLLLAFIIVTTVLVYTKYEDEIDNQFRKIGEPLSNEFIELISAPYNIAQNIIQYVSEMFYEIAVKLELIVLKLSQNIKYVFEYKGKVSFNLQRLGVGIRLFIYDIPKETIEILIHELDNKVKEINSIKEYKAKKYAYKISIFERTYHLVIYEALRISESVFKLLLKIYDETIFGIRWIIYEFENFVRSLFKKVFGIETIRKYDKLKEESSVTEFVLGEEFSKELKGLEKVKEDKTDNKYSKYLEYIEKQLSKGIVQPQYEYVKAKDFEIETKQDIQRNERVSKNKYDDYLRYVDNEINNNEGYLSKQNKVFETGVKKIKERIEFENKNEKKDKSEQKQMLMDLNQSEKDQRVNLKFEKYASYLENEILKGVPIKKFGSIVIKPITLVKNKVKTIIKNKDDNLEIKKYDKYYNFIEQRLRNDEGIGKYDTKLINDYKSKISELDNYINDAISSNISKKEIVDSLVLNGWPIKYVSKKYDFLNKFKIKQNEKREKCSMSEIYRLEKLENEYDNRMKVKIEDETKEDIIMFSDKIKEIDNEIENMLDYSFSKRKIISELKKKGISEKVIKRHLDLFNIKNGFEKIKSNIKNMKSQNKKIKEYGYTSSFDEFIYNMILQGKEKNDIKVMLIKQGWPKKFVNEYYEDMHEEYLKKALEFSQNNPEGKKLRLIEKYIESKLKNMKS